MSTGYQKLFVIGAGWRSRHTTICIRCLHSRSYRPQEAQLKWKMTSLAGFYLLVIGRRSCLLVRAGLVADTRTGLCTVSFPPSAVMITELASWPRERRDTRGLPALAVVPSSTSPGASTPPPGQSWYPQRASYQDLYFSPFSLSGPQCSQGTPRSSHSYVPSSG